MVLERFWGQVWPKFGRKPEKSEGLGFLPGVLIFNDNLRRTRNSNTSPVDLEWFQFQGLPWSRRFGTVRGAADEARGIPKLFFGPPNYTLSIKVLRQGQNTSRFLNMRGFGALVPQASKKPLGQQKHFGMHLNKALI